RIAPGPVDQTGGEPLGVVEQHLEQVLGRKLLMSLAQRERLGGLDETAAAVRVFVEIHGLFPRPIPNALTARSEHRRWVVLKRIRRLPDPDQPTEQVNTWEQVIL